MAIKDMNSGTRTEFRVCFLSGTCYADPLDASFDKKFRHLAKRADVRVVGFAAGVMPRRFTHHAVFYLLPNPRVPVLRYAVMFAVAPLLALWLIFRHGTNILVAQSPYEGFAGAWVKEFSRRMGQKVALVVESHGDFDEFIFLHRRVVFPGFLRMLMQYASRFALRRADLLRAVSVATAHKLESLAPGKPIFRFPAWTDRGPFLDAFEQNGKKSSDNRGYFLYCGTISPAKGVHHLVEAFGCIAADFPGLRLLLAGHAADGAYARELRSRVERDGLQKRVIFMGHLSRPELAVTMSGAIACILPSLSEGLSRVVLEAMAAGTAVIATRVGGNPELVRDGTTGFLVPPADKKTLAEKMARLSEDPDLAARMGQRAHSLAGSLFSGRAYTEHYVESYVRLFREAKSLLGVGVSVSGSVSVSGNGTREVRG